MGTGLWYQDTIEQLTANLSHDDDVRGLVLIGSLARDDVAADIWCDIDVVVIVRDQALARFYPGAEWTSCVGETYCVNCNSTGDWHVVRACYTDGRRIDFVIILEGSLDKIEGWEKNPLCYANACLFSRSSVLDRALHLQFSPQVFTPVSPESFEQMANDFWFKGMLAVSKVGRDELLVALHLSLDMIRDCLVLAMMIRDRDTGTNHHRDGSQGNHLVPMLEGTCQPYTPEGILDSIEQSAIAFDRLSAQWDDHYEERRAPLLNWIARARESMKR